jgi:hypothetical protein
MKTKKNFNKNKKNPRKLNMQNVALQLHPSWPGQPVAQFKVELTRMPIVTAASVVAMTYTPNLANIALFSTRFASLFEEYRIIKVDLYIVGVGGSGNTGCLQMWFDEKDATVPTLAESLRKTPRQDTWNVSNIVKPHQMSWLASDTLDLEYTDVGTTVSPVHFKAYGDGSLGLVAASTVAVITGTVTIQFRGYQ